MAGSPLDEVVDTVKDAAYVSVGLGVLAFQRLQVRRQELAKALDARGDEAKGTVEALGGALLEQVKLVEERVGAARRRTGS